MQYIKLLLCKLLNGRTKRLNAFQVSNKIENIELVSAGNFAFAELANRWKTTVSHAVLRIGDDFF